LHGLPQDATLPATLDRSTDDGANPWGDDGPDHLVEWDQVVCGDEAGQLDEHRWQQRLGIDQRLDGFQLENAGRLIDGIDEAGDGSLAEGHADPMPDFDHTGQRVGDRVIEEAAETPDARLYRDLRNGAQTRLRRQVGCQGRGIPACCEWHRWHPRSVRPPPISVAAEYLPPHR